MRGMSLFLSKKSNNRCHFQSLQEGYNLTALVDSNSTSCEPHCDGDCTHGRCYAPQSCECNEDYLATNDSQGYTVCVHACGGECAHGACVMDNGTCECFYGWTGTFCDVPTKCVVVVPDDFPLNRYNDMMKVSDILGMC